MKVVMKMYDVDKFKNNSVPRIKVFMHDKSRMMRRKRYIKFTLERSENGFILQAFDACDLSAIDILKVNTHYGINDVLNYINRMMVGYDHTEIEYYIREVK